MGWQAVAVVAIGPTRKNITVVGLMLLALPKLN